jgi:hypothetical protein
LQASWLLSRPVAVAGSIQSVSSMNWSIADEHVAPDEKARIFDDGQVPE